MAKAKSSNKTKSESTEKESRENKKSLLNMIKLDVYLKDGKIHKAAELAQALGKSKRTVLREIEELRVTWGAPVEATRDGYRYTERSWFFPAIYLCESDMLTLGILSKSFEIYKETPLWEPMQDILDIIFSPHDNTTSIISKDNQNFAFKEYRIKENDWFDNRICIPRQPQFKVEDQVWHGIISSLKQNKVLQFDYASNNESETLTRTVESWQLCFDSGRWYLYGKCLTKGGKKNEGPRTYNLEKIKNIKLLDQTFKLPDPKIYRKNEYAVGNFGISTTATTEHYKIILRDYAAAESIYKWSKDYKVYEYKNLDDSQKLSGIDIADDAKVIEFSSNQRPGVESFVFQFAANAIPLEPPSLVEKWKKNIAEMAKIAKKIK